MFGLKLITVLFLIHSSFHIGYKYFNNCCGNKLFALTVNLTDLHRDRNPADVPDRHDTLFDVNITSLWGKTQLTLVQLGTCARAAAIHFSLVKKKMKRHGPVRLVLIWVLKLDILNQSAITLIFLSLKKRDLSLIWDLRLRRKCVFDDWVWMKKITARSCGWLYP